MKTKFWLVCLAASSMGGFAAAQTFTLNITAVNGTVYKKPDTASYSAGDTVVLVGRPDVGYYFTGWSGDMRSAALSLEVVVRSNMKIIAHFDAWKPPIGIPAPPFGIFERHTMYSGKTFDFGSGPAPYKTGKNGPYTHHVDAANANATDTDNPYGTAEKPRKSFPANITAGSVVELHRGPYQITLQELKGTAEKPVFIRGANGAEPFTVTGFTGGSYSVMNSEYLIVEHAVIDGVRLQVGQLASHLSFRHCEIDGNDSTPGVYLWTHKATFIPGQFKNHIVFFGNIVHDCGKYPAASESVCAFMIDNATQNVWILDNRIFENGEDGVHILDRTILSNGLPVNTPQADRIFIGRNLFHHDIENAIDAKGCTNVIISQNEMYGYEVLVAASNGDAIRINDEGYQKNIWIVFNRIHDSKWAIGAYGAIDPPTIIGNIMYNLKAAIAKGGTGDVIGNVVYNCASGIEAGSGTKTIANNSVAATAAKPVAGGSDVRNNLFWQNGATVKCSLSVEADPLFRDAANHDFGLKPGSPAIDKGSSEAIERICEKFEQLYGVDLRYDFAGTKRPQGGGWDIGAYEFVSNPVIHSIKKPVKDASAFAVRRKNGRLVVSFVSEKESDGVVRVYDMKGAAITTAVYPMSIGTTVIEWDGFSDDAGRTGAGCRIVTLRTEQGVYSQKVLFSDEINR